jgi:hypothetical protein
MRSNPEEDDHWVVKNINDYIAHTITDSVPIVPFDGVSDFMQRHSKGGEQCYLTRLCFDSNNKTSFQTFVVVFNLFFFDIQEWNGLVSCDQ